MKNVIIAGAGFAGIKAANYLSKEKSVSVTLIDSNSYTTLLPSLPDLVSGKLLPATIIYPIEKIINKRVSFINETIIKIDPTGKYVYTKKNNLKYDYLIIATGSKTTAPLIFEGSDIKVLTMNSYDDTVQLKNNFINYSDSEIRKRILIIGAGYTGLELTFALKKLSALFPGESEIYVMEKGKDILPFISNKERAYLKSYLTSNNIKLLTASEITSIKYKELTINNDIILKNPLVFWTAGSGTIISNLIEGLKFARDGRIIVNEYLQAENFNNIYAVGDSAAIKYKNSFLRKAVNFSIYSGKSAAINISKSVKGKKLKKFRPVDLGWVIPIGGKSLGHLFNLLCIKEKLGLRLHYLMSAYRSYSLKAKLDYLKRVIFP